MNPHKTLVNPVKTPCSVKCFFAMIDSATSLSSPLKGIEAPLAKTWCLKLALGGGKLTKVLLERGWAVTAVEADERFCRHLERIFPNELKEGTLRIVHCPILNFDMGSWLEAKGQGKRFVCGNLPYHLSSQILLWLIDYLPLLEASAFMLQHEYASRLVAEPRAKAYGRLSVLLQLAAELDYVAKVPRECFKPVPKVDSAIVRIVPKEEGIDRQALAQVSILTREMFSRRRKMIRSSWDQIRGVFSGLGASIPPVVWESMLGQADIEGSQRCEELTPAQFLRLAVNLPPP